MTKQSLSTIQPDFEGILEQLQTYVSSKQSWLSLRKSATAKMLLEAIAMVGEYDQYSIGAAVGETTFDNAHLPESIYTNCRFLGIRITRKTPAHCTVTLQNTNLRDPYLEIPLFTQFDINGVKYFNRERIIFNTTSQKQNVELYQGEIRQSTFIVANVGTNENPQSSSYQTYELEEKTKWSISNEDIICYTIDTNQNIVNTFTRSTEPVFQFKTSDFKFYENSLPNGNVECKFGADPYGQSPTAGLTLLFKYAVTLGSDGNNALNDLEVKCGDYPTIVGESLTNSYGGGDEKTVDVYKELGPNDGASYGRGITREDFKPLVIKYPGIIDCNVYGQAEIAPNDKRWMNVIGLMLLTEDSFSQADWKGLIKYLRKNSIYGFQYKWYKPIPVNVNINIKIYLKPTADSTKCRDIVVTNLEKYTTLKLGSLGRSLYGSDIENLVLSSIPNDIDYIDKEVPLIDYVIDKNQYINVKSINVETYYSERDTQYWINPIDPYNHKE